MSRLETNYTITWLSGTFTVTYASVYSPLSFGDNAYIAYVITNSSTYITVGQPDALVTLNWNLNTNLGASSASDLITKIAALTSSTATYTTLTTTTINNSGTLTSGVVNGTSGTITTLGATTANITTANITTGIINTFKTSVMQGQASNTNTSIAADGTGRVVFPSSVAVGTSTTPDTTTLALQTLNTATGNGSRKKIVVFSGADNSHQFCGIGMTASAMNLQTNDIATNVDFDHYVSSSSSATHCRIKGSSEIDVDTVSSISTDTDLSLQGNGTGVVKIVDGLKFPTSGGTAASLTFNEELDGQTITFTGCFNVGQNVTIAYHKRGRRVTVHCDSVSAAANASNSQALAAAGQVPARFRPVQAVNIPCIVVETGADVYQPGSVLFGTDGAVTISVLLAAARPNFANSSTNGWSVWTATYLSG